MRRLLGLLLIVMVTGVGGCGVAPQDEPTPVDIGTSAAGASAPPTIGALSLTVYFIEGERLIRASRRAADTSSLTTLELVAAGITPAERTAGLRTAVAREAFEQQPDDLPGTVLVSAPRPFATGGGTDQLLAVAQLVWTLTELPGIQQVRFAVSGEVIEVPTDGGLTRGPVRRADFLSVAPLPAATGASSSP